MLRCVLISRRNLDIEHQAQPGHLVGVVDMAGASGLLGIVARHSPLLVAVKRLDGKRCSAPIYRAFSRGGMMGLDEQRSFQF
jgi:hypothetical protein